MTSSAPQPAPARSAAPQPAAPGGPAPREDERPLVAVLFGGRSSEHAVSCVGAKAVIGAIDGERYRVLPIGITQEGTWRRVEDWADFAFDPQRMPEVADDGTEILVAPSGAHSPLRERLADGTVRELGRVDAFFPVLHGKHGEDGTVQGLFELMDTPFVGGGVLTSAVSMDKHFMKVVLAGAGIPACPWETLTAAQWATDPEVAAQRVSEQGFPAFVKPARAGSSVGISRIESVEQLPAAMAEALAHDDKVIVEPGIDGREIECSVLGGRGDAQLRTSLPAEIIVKGDHAFYDFEAKYLDADGAEVVCPADLDPETTARVQDVARRTFRAFDCTGLARVDTFVTPAGEVLVNELNTLPGFTPTSGYPLMFAASGVGFEQLVAELLDIALCDAR